LGSNQRHPQFGAPAQILSHAVDALEMPDVDVFAASAIIASKPIGPSKRQFANSAVIVGSSLMPDTLLSRLQSVEDHFGRERRGQKWRARVLDIDIILWSGGMWADDKPALAIPHPFMRNRSFVLTTAAMIAANWIDPVTGLTIAQLQKRFTRPKPLDRCD
jgi:2-amino-4-hydroxy-6-hydroxymethyldihydropteridine diphosphokinase